MPTTRTALVTGGNRGIGLAIAEGLSARGLRVLIGSREPGEGAAGSPGPGGSSWTWRIRPRSPRPWPRPGRWMSW